SGPVRWPDRWAARRRWAAGWPGPWPARRPSCQRRPAPRSCACRPDEIDMSVLERLKEVNAKQPPEESALFRIAVLVAVMAAALAVITEDVGSPALHLAVGAGIPLAFWFSWWARHREGFWVKVALAAVVVLVFANFLAKIGGVQVGSFA